MNSRDKRRTYDHEIFVTTPPYVHNYCYDHLNCAFETMNELTTSNTNAKDPWNNERVQKQIARHARLRAINKLSPIPQLHTSPLHKLSVRPDLACTCHQPIKVDTVGSVCVEL